MGTDLFLWHGYSVLWLDGEWRKASPAFNAECADVSEPNRSTSTVDQMRCSMPTTVEATATWST